MNITTVHAGVQSAVEMLCSEFTNESKVHLHFHQNASMLLNSPFVHCNTNTDQSCCKDVCECFHGSNWIEISCQIVKSCHAGFLHTQVYYGDKGQSPVTCKLLSLHSWFAIIPQSPIIPNYLIPINTPRKAKLTDSEKQKCWLNVERLNSLLSVLCSTTDTSERIFLCRMSFLLLNNWFWMNMKRPSFITFVCVIEINNRFTLESRICVKKLQEIIVNYSI